MDHNHDHALFGNHICMWEGPTHTPSALEVNYNLLKSQHENNTEELRRLRALLDANQISWAKPNPAALMPFTTSTSSRQTTFAPLTRSARAKLKAIELEKSLPHLPNEIILRILSLAVTQPRPVIDPFWKLDTANITQTEKSHAAISVSFLATCKALRTEGIRLLIMNNEFIFTQVEALQNFTNYSSDARASIKHVTLRVVGRYYDDTSYRKSLRGTLSYHSSLASPTVLVRARPLSSPKGKGIQSYCWQQLVDFLKALVIRKGPAYRNRHLLTGLTSMRVDLVNFCEHIPFLGSPFISIIRWHVGKLLDELIVTGAPDEEWSAGEERFIGGLVRDDGLFGTGCPVFVSTKGDRLKALPGFGLNLQIINPSESADTPGGKVKAVRHPEGGFPPKSKYGSKLTVWRWTFDHLNKPQRKWVEFHKKCGLPVDDCGELQAMLDDDGWEDTGANAEGLLDLD